MILEFAAKSRTLAERNWDTRDRECYAIRWAVERFREYTKAGKCVISIDHESLKLMDGTLQRKGEVKVGTVFATT